MIGETIKDFTITGQLGRGGMGDVFVAEQRLIKTRVAIKMLQPQISADKAHVDRFFNEAIAVSKIKHAGIVKIFDVGFHLGRAYLVMELLEGEPLSARLQRGLPFEATITIARQIVSVLDATHAAGIVHRDLKPDNIFLVSDAELGERVRILDFGIAKLVDVKATSASMSMGTPAYMPPELWKDAATSDAATDVYALGCVLFELCTGRPPFIVTAVAEACGRHLSEIPPRVRSLRAELPAALDDLIVAMLEKDQAARPSTKAIASVLSSISLVGVGATMPQGPAPAPTPSPIVHGTAMSLEDLEASGRWMEVVKLLGKQVEAAPPSAKAALNLRIATIYTERFANMAEAIKAYERVLVHEPDHRTALDALRALYEKRRDWEKLLELEKGELGRTSPEKRADKAVEVAKLASARVSKPDVQLYWWERVLEHEPDHRQAFAELAKLYEHAERWEDLAGLLQRRADIASGHDDRIASLRKLAAVRGGLQADSAGAIEALMEILDLDPNDKVAKQALVDLRANKDVAWSALGEGYRVGERSLAQLGDKPAPSIEPSKSPTAPAKPSAVADTGTHDPSRPASSKTKLVAAGGLVVALGVGGMVFAMRGGSKDKDAVTTAGSALTGSQPTSSLTTRSQPTGSQTPGSQAEAGGSAQGSATKAEASGLVLSYRVLSKSPTATDFHVIKPGEQLHTDDRLAFEVMTSEQAHVFLSQRPKGKSLALLFPNAGIDVTNPLPPNTWTRIPSGTRSFRLNDKDVGMETVFFVASRTPPPNLAAAIANDGKPGAKANAVEDQIVAVAMEKRGDCIGRGREIVLDGEDDCKVKTRGLELDDEKQAKRVRGMTIEDVVFVPFRFEHLGGKR